MLRRKMGRLMMAATLGLTCLLVGATSQANVLVSGIRVKCISQNEIGQDEIFLKFGGMRLNMGNFSNGTDVTSPTNLNIAQSLPMVVQLWEDDGNHWYDGDDLWDSNSWVNTGNYTVHNSSNGGQSHDYYYFWTFTNV